MNEIAGIRKEYKLKSLDEAEAAADALQQFHLWWEEAQTSAIEEVNACTLATATAAGKPSARIVLLKGYDENGFIFFTNYESRKGKELTVNPQAYMVFFWKELERQVRIEGTVQKTSSEESDVYFLSRPLISQAGAWASPQSSVIPDRQIIEDSAKKYAAQFSNDNAGRPPHWGGYRLSPQAIEFWQGRPGRLHDRLLYTLQPEINPVKWKIQRLAP